MSNPALTEHDWQAIDHVLLDLDGTLLDLDFDNHFWQQLVPRIWGEARGLGLAQAQAELRPRFRAVEGTLDWYSTEYWSRELALDIPALKRLDADRIRWLPGAEHFIAEARRRGKQLVLLTDSHPQAIAVKDARTGFVARFDRVFSSHGFGAPKMQAGCWRALAAAMPYEPGRALFVDDTAKVLVAAQAAGIGLLRAIRRPDSRGVTRGHEEFVAVDAIVDLIGGIQR
jgi:putative hydrolase of the HAD superfamily